jgi:DNA ligase (NAD+)
MPSKMDDLIRDPINYLNKSSVKHIVDILNKSDKAFFNTDEVILSDDIYDIVKQYLRNKDPENAYLKKVGAEIEFNKEVLPIYLGSLDKIKDNESEIKKWQMKYPGDSGYDSYVVSEKLDGISCLLYHDCQETKMFTRGNGSEGQNITHILPYLNLDISEITKIREKIAIRGELIISRKNWNKISDIGSNARNVVAGAIHSKSINREIISNIDFIAYDMMSPRYKQSVAYEIMGKMNIPVVRNILLENDMLSLDTLSNLLQKWRKDSKYEIDGIVVHHNSVHEIVTGKNPKYAFAFKTILTHEQAEVIVTDVEWNVSKHRYLKPLVKFNEVNLGGVNIKQATGFNGSFIEKNKIGPGSHIIIVRSGDVIPHILNVLTASANGQAKMPEVPYKWTDTEVDILLLDSGKNKEQDVQSFTHFMKTLDIAGVKEGMIAKLYDAGYDTLGKIIRISVEEMSAIPGFQEKSALKTYETLQKVHEAECNKLLTASNVFGRGFGERKLKIITEEYEYVAYDRENALKLKIEDIERLKGMARISAEQFIEGLPKFFEFCDELGIKCKKEKKKDAVDKNSILNGKKIVFSGFRNKELEKIIEGNGGVVTTTVSKSTDYLIVKSEDETSTKIDKAREYGIAIITVKDFERFIS